MEKCWWRIERKLQARIRFFASWKIEACWKVKVKALLGLDQIPKVSEVKDELGIQEATRARPLQAAAASAASFAMGMAPE